MVFDFKQTQGMDEMNRTKLAGLFGTLIVAAAVALSSFLVLDAGNAAAQPVRQPFSNAVEQRAGMIRELQEIKTLLKEQNALLRQIAGKKGNG